MLAKTLSLRPTNLTQSNSYYSRNYAQKLITKLYNYYEPYFLLASLYTYGLKQLKENNLFILK
jgi:hypothetical protein